MQDRILDGGQGGGAVALPRFEEKYKLPLKGVDDAFLLCLDSDTITIILLHRTIGYIVNELQIPGIGR